MKRWHAALVLVVLLAGALVAASAALDRDGEHERVLPIDVAPLDQSDRKSKPKSSRDVRRKPQPELTRPRPQRPAPAPAPPPPAPLGGDDDDDGGGDDDDGDDDGGDDD